MWHLSDRERAILRRIIPTDQPTWDQTPVQLPGNPTVEQLMKKNRLSAAEVRAIYEVLPADAEFFRFVEALRPRTSAEEQAEAEMDDEQIEAKRAYRARLERLRRKQEDQQYAEMTRSIDPTRARPLLADLGKEMREVNKQLVAVINTLITVGGAFAFGFFGVQFAYPHLQFDIASRMLLGLVPATVVFFADLYFLIKGMDDGFDATTEDDTKKNCRTMR